MTLAAWTLGTLAYCAARPLGAAFAAVFAALATVALPVIAGAGP